jgi:alpha-tubulin suppressor-like RCC1 family protein
LSLELVIDLYTLGPTFQPTVQPSLSQNSPNKLFSTGAWHVVSIQPDGTAFSWGSDNYGQLGRGIVSSYEASPGLMVDITAASDVSAGQGLTVLVQDATVWSVGWNVNGQLGDNTTTSKSTAEPLATLSSGVARVVCALFHACALLKTGDLFCWGLNDQGQLGIGASTVSSSPVLVTVFVTSGVASVSVGSKTTCILTSSGVAKCAGRNDDGQLGDGTYTPQNTFSTEVVGVVLPVGPCLLFWIYNLHELYPGSFDCIWYWRSLVRVGLEPRGALLWKK